MSVWVHHDFKEAIERLAAAAGRTQSDLLREGLTKVALDAVRVRRHRSG